MCLSKYLASKLADTVNHFNGFLKLIVLKIVCNEKEGGPGRWQKISKRSRTVAFEDFFSFYLVVIFKFNVQYFHFRRVRHSY
jgi:hypothetical protein